MAWFFDLRRIDEKQRVPPLVTNKICNKNLNAKDQITMHNKELILSPLNRE